MKLHSLGEYGFKDPISDLHLSIFFWVIGIGSPITDLVLLGDILDELICVLSVLIDGNFSWKFESNKDIFIQKVIYYFLNGPCKCFGLHPLRHLVNEY